MTEQEEAFNKFKTYVGAMPYTADEINLDGSLATALSYLMDVRQMIDEYWRKCREEAKVVNLPTAQPSGDVAAILAMFPQPKVKVRR